MRRDNHDAKRQEDYIRALCSEVDELRRERDANREVGIQTLDLATHWREQRDAYREELATANADLGSARAIAKWLMAFLTTTQREEARETFPNAEWL